MMMESLHTFFSKLAGSFDRPVGAEADVNELEYISFLMQATDTRADCSINAEDIQLFLKSRYGIDVTIEVVKERIMKSLGGGNDIDLMELTAILLLPILLKSAAIDYKGQCLSTQPFSSMDRSTTDGNIFGTSNGPNEVKSNRLPEAALTQPPSTVLVLENGNNSMLSNNGDQGKETIAIVESDEVEEDVDVVNDGMEARTLPQGVLLPPRNIFEYASKLLLHDLTGDAVSNEPLTEEFLQRILRNYGEYEVADNYPLVKEMVKVATDATRELVHDHDDDVVLFNGATFAAATTHDVEKYDLSAETKMTTLYDDVFPPGGTEILRDTQKTFTASQIDVTVGNFRSKTLMILLWTTSVISFCVFYIRRADNAYEGKEDVLSAKRDYCKEKYPYTNTWAVDTDPWVVNRNAMGCDVGLRVRDWLCIFLIVGSYGFAFTFLGSIGNTTTISTWWRPLVGCVPVLGLAAISLYDPPSLAYLRVLSSITMILGFVVVCYHVGHIISIIISKEHLQQNPGLRERLGVERVKWLRKHFSRPREIEVELLGKKAMACKLNSLMRNSIRLFREAESNESFVRTYYNRAIYAFAKYGIHTTDKNIGGLLWTWQSIYNKTLYTVEGVRFSVRVVASNIAQFVVCMLVIWIGYQLFSYVNENFGDPTSFKMSAFIFLNDQLKPKIEDKINKATNSNNTDTSELLDIATNAMRMSVDQLVDSYYPEQKYMVMAPLTVGFIAAFLTSFSLSVNCLSNTAAIIMQLRCGQLQSLHSKDAFRYRAQPDTVALLTGSIFWGCLVASIVAGLFWGSIVFLFVWQVTVVWVQKLLAILIGLLAIVCLRFLHLLYREGYYSGFYRRDPLLCNIGLLVLEWASFTLSVGMILARMILLLFMAAFCAGRVYRPFLAPGLGQLGLLEWDPYYTIYVRELMAHEAHRHPYIELIGYVYMMKLRHPNSEFGTTAGSTWRLLFVHALFPWLHRYRLEARRPTTSRPSTLSDAQKHRMRYEGPSIIERLQKLDEVSVATTSNSTDTMLTRSMRTTFGEGDSLHSKLDSTPMHMSHSLYFTKSEESKEEEEEEEEEEKSSKIDSETETNNEIPMSVSMTTAVEDNVDVATTDFVVTNLNDIESASTSSSSTHTVGSDRIAVITDTAATADTERSCAHLSSSALVEDSNDKKTEIDHVTVNEMIVQSNEC